MEVERIRYDNPINYDGFQINGNLYGSLHLTVQQLSDQTEKHRKKIVQWLYAANFQQSFYTAHRKLEPNTGRWFLQHDHFEAWKYKRNTLLWLAGKRKLQPRSSCVSV